MLFWACINIMPYSMSSNLGRVKKNAQQYGFLWLINRSSPVRILYYMLVKVDQFIFQTNFVILDFEIDSKIHIILGRPFLATGRVLGKVESGE